jgi:hypothetical protein
VGVISREYFLHPLGLLTGREIWGISKKLIESLPNLLSDGDDNRVMGAGRIDLLRSP